MAPFIYQKLNSHMARAFLKNVNEEATQLFKKQVIFFFTVFFYPMFHNIILKTCCLFASLIFFSFLSLFVELSF